MHVGLVVHVYVYNRPQANTFHKKRPSFLGMLYNPMESKGTPAKVYRFLTGNEQVGGSRTGQLLPSKHQGILNSGSVIFPDHFPITFPDTVPRAMTVPSINSQSSQE